MEELDVVIDLLSGFPKRNNGSSCFHQQSSCVVAAKHAYPGGLPPKHPAPPSASLLPLACLSSKAVGSQLSHSPQSRPAALTTAAFPSHMFIHPPPPLPNDTAFEQSYIGNVRSNNVPTGNTVPARISNQKTNTWPYRLQHKVATDVPPGGSGLTGSMPPYSHNAYAYDGAHVSDAEYKRYLAAVKQMKMSHHHTQHNNHHNLLQTTNPWSTPSTQDKSANNSWPRQPTCPTREGYVDIARNWYM